MLSSYRLGDLVIHHLDQHEKDELERDFPNSLGAQYLLQMRNLSIGNDIPSRVALFSKLVLNHIKLNATKFPKNITESTVIHLRLGDVIAGNTGHEQSKRPLSVSHLSDVLAKDADTRYVLGKCFFAKPSSKNYDECITQSEVYLQSVLRELRATHLDMGDADLDLCCGVMCKTFVQGKGFFSRLIVDIRKHIGMTRNIETITCVGHQN